jgi:hypothetical protein
LKTERSRFLQYFRSSYDTSCGDRDDSSSGVAVIGPHQTSFGVIGGEEGRAASWTFIERFFKSVPTGAKCLRAAKTERPQV